MNYKNFIKRIFGIFIALALFICGVQVLNFVYVSPNLENRIMWKSFYEQDDIDTVFLGSSLVFCGVDIAIYEERTKEKAFSMATGSQRLHEAYYNLMEADRRYGIKKAYIELNCMLETDIWGDYDSALVMSDSWTDTDYMRMGVNKLRALFDINESEYLIQAFMPFTRYRAYIFDKAHILETINLKRSESYKSYSYVNNYADGNGSHTTELDLKGYWQTTRVLKNPVSIQAQTGDTMFLTEDAEKYLRKMLKYCKKHNIEPVLFMTPMYEAAVISTEDYDRYHDSVEKISDEFNVKLLDFNLVKEDYLTLENDDFFDISHLNSSGADKFTDFLTDICENTAAADMTYDYDSLHLRLYDTDSEAAYFYGSYRDKLANEKPRVYGLYFSKGAEYTGMHIAASDNDSMEFMVTFRPNDENGNPSDIEEPVQTYSKNRDFEIPLNTHGIFTIYTQMQNNSIDFQPLSCTY